MRLILSLTLALTAVFSLPSQAADRPNFVWIVSEDNSKHYLDLFDEAGVETPNIAALAEHGVLYPRAFSNSPVCSVARTTLATGCYAPRIGTQFHRRSKSAGLPEGLSLFYGILTKAGYFTTNNSKQDYNTNLPENTWNESSKGAHWRNRPETSQPFFHMQSHTETHESSLHFSQESYENEATTNDPATVTLPPYFPDTPLFRYTYARYLDNIQKIDAIVGDTLAQLEEDGLLEDTFVFYFGDHGGVLPRGKGYVYESGLHVPLVIRVPEKWKHLVSEEIGTEQPGFVSFIDFGPTVLNLAGIEVPQQMDGSPFLGENVNAADVALQNSAFGYADRFDEKYETIRTLRVGDWKYIRSFQPWYPDGLQNNYRYKMLAYREWRELFEAGKLGSDQRQFFDSKPAEMLFDLSADPHEVNDLSSDPAQSSRLREMRNALTKKLKALPDLSLFPESQLYTEAMENPVAFGQKNKDRIGKAIDTANLALLSFGEARDALTEAFTSDDPLQRLWASSSCAAFGSEAEELAEAAMPLLNDSDPIVRVRTAEFLGQIGKTDPRETLIDVINKTDEYVVALIALNAVIYFHDHQDLSYPLKVDALTIESDDREIQNRLGYLRGDWLTSPPKWKKKKSKK
ncbi:MAG: sulfatase-like hydrolase/transferase [Verrucomicrobiales bacterium]|nr:sulfatase-like hydrolase/transferase [Verrucomicrobiales bacterium]